MEQLLHYVWKHRLYPLAPLTTTDGQPVEVIDPGLPNRDSGPDFFNAKVRIGPTLWVGNVEIHERASDWYLHGHERDPHYDNVVLHVVGVADRQAITHDGHPMPTLCLTVPPEVSRHYADLLRADSYPPCHDIIGTLPRLTLHAWMSALQTERLMHQTEAIARRAGQNGGSWEAAHFATLARNFGFGINGEAMEQWAAHIPLLAADHHRDDLFQIEALFMGQAGLLRPEAVPERYREAAAADEYMARLGAEYRYLARKFDLQPMDHGLWRFMRLRPQGFPHIRIAQMARLYHERRAGLSQLLACRTLDEVTRLIRIGVTPYWETHYTFGVEAPRHAKTLSAASVRLLIINTLVPMLFAYGRHRHDETLCDRALDLLQQLPPEDNHIVRMWRRCGMPCDHAADSQALIELSRAYCDRRDCLRCRIGYHYLSTPAAHARPAADTASPTP